MSVDIDLLKTGTIEGDFVISECEQQNIQTIIQTGFNSFKEFPTMGVNILKYLNGSFDPNGLIREIKTELQADGLSNIEVSLNTTNGLEVNILNATRL